MYASLSLLVLGLAVVCVSRFVRIQAREAALYGALYDAYFVAENYTERAEHWEARGDLLCAEIVQLEKE